MNARRVLGLLGPAVRDAAVSIAAALIAIVLVAGSGQAAEGNPADAILDQARAAVKHHEFKATVRIWWRDSDGGHSESVEVVAIDGGLRLADGRVLEQGGRTWIRAGRRWTTLWADIRDTRAPTMARKYAVLTHRGPQLIGRLTRELVVRRRGHVVERIAIDRGLGLVLRWDRFDANGALSSRVQLVRLTDVRDRRGDLEVPKVGTDAPRKLNNVPSGVPRSVGDGFVLIDSRRLTNETQGRYSDGISELSVFTRFGDLDWDSLPAGGRAVRYGSVHARRFRTASGTVIVWQSRGRVLTCVTDAAGADEAGIVEDLARDDESTWTGVLRFVTSPFQWN